MYDTLGLAHDGRRGSLEKSQVAVLVVDDYEAFRKFICSVLVKNSRLEIVGEASDGLDAVCKAEQLQPDLVVLDLGLPKLNGIEVARQIRVSVPQSKILFLTLETSPDVVQEALSTGARGYVAKAKAGTELMAAVDAVLEGRRFISSNLNVDPDSFEPLS
jgi:DNA-binding NarL/FixJ family response regulator